VLGPLWLPQGRDAATLTAVGEVRRARITAGKVCRAQATAGEAQGRGTTARVIARELGSPQGRRVVLRLSQGRRRGGVPLLGSSQGSRRGGTPCSGRSDRRTGGTPRLGRRRGGTSSGHRRGGASRSGRRRGRAPLLGSLQGRGIVGSPHGRRAMLRPQLGRKHRRRGREVGREGRSRSSQITRLNSYDLTPRRSYLVLFART
jgi:hypothetical protein